MTKIVSSRNAAMQLWQAYLVNRAKRNRDNRFLIQGVRPITLAVRHGWPLESLLYRHGGAPLSAWARELLATAGVPAIGVVPELLAELGEKGSRPAETDGAAPELVAVAHLRQSALAEFRPAGPAPVIVVFDRPSSPGNLGTLIRSADAFGACAVVVSGHGADHFDPQCVRAATGSLFAIPVFRVNGTAEVLAFRQAQPAAARIVGTDESGPRAVYDHDFTAATILVVGNETRGMSAAWRTACDDVVRIPIGGAASSLGAPSAAAVVLYELARQRAVAPPSG